MNPEEGKDRNRTELLRRIRDEVINFKESPLYRERIQNGVFPVIGEGNHYAEIMFVGEAPGKTEAETGRPFSGAAGKILDEMLASAGIPRKEVYITNVVKDRPPMNRDPRPEEILYYAPFLDRQIEIIQPKVIVPLGRHSMKYIMDKYGLEAENLSISKIHGQVFAGKEIYGEIKIIPMYHPAAALYTQELKRVLLEDFQILKGAAI